MLCRGDADRGTQRSPREGSPRDCETTSQVLGAPSTSSASISPADLLRHLVRGARARRSVELLREVCVVSAQEIPVAEVQEIHLSRRDRGLGIPDTACRVAVSGDKWWYDYKEDLENAGLGEFVTEKEERERYMFGSDGVKESFLHVVCPAIIAGRAMLVAFSVVRSDSLALLIGKDQMRKHGIWSCTSGAGCSRWAARVRSSCLHGLATTRARCVRRSSARA